MVSLKSLEHPLNTLKVHALQVSGVSDEEEPERQEEEPPEAGQRQVSLEAYNPLVMAFFK